ncbi:MAG: carboxypeptidase regulatory-like domain-containing protein [Acidobacteriaceae bacterium]|nr:carboxypeptidase regulatory-like domain-containing protein [Acidobacteriaceae bacterium]
MRSGQWLVACVLGAILAVSGRAFAQNSGGSVTGKVQDASGAVVQGAAVTLTSSDQGTVRKATTNERGEFSFPETTPGTYRLRVRVQGFEAYVIEGLKVETDQETRADAHMVLGSVQTEVVVDSSGSTVDTRSATVGVLIEKKLVEDLPLESGNVVALAALLPGVSSVNAPATFTSDVGGPTYTVSGSRVNQNLFLLDGVLWNNLYLNTGLNFPPRQGLQEVSVLLNNYKAQYGRNVGSIYNVITKSGTNTVHGQVWEYLQNTALNAADYFTQINPKLIANEFGFTVGGPMVRDKLFYQLTYQDLRVEGTNIGNLYSPSALERGLQPDGTTPHPCSATGPFAGQLQCADFTTDINLAANHTGASTIVNTLYDNGKGYVPYVTSMYNAAYTQGGGTLATGQDSPCVALLKSVLAANPGTKGKYFSTPEVPSVCFNPVIQSLISHGYVPLPDHYNSSGQFIVSTQAKLPRNDQNAMLRLDYHLGRHNLDARYYQQNADDHLAPGVATGSQVGGVLGASTGNAAYDIAYDTGKNRLGAISDTFVMTSNLLNVARAAYKRYVFVQFPTDQTTLSTLGASMSLPGHPTLPYFGLSGRMTLGTQNEGYQNKVNGSVQLDDTVTWTHGNHTVMAGVEFLRLEYLNHTENPGELGYSSTYSGLNVSDFLQGLPETNYFSSPLLLSGQEHALYLFAQDDWRASAKLTLNFGLRYELPFQWYQPKGNAQTFIPGFQSTRFTGAPGGLAFTGDRGIGKAVAKTDYNEWQPRLGFAYDIFGNGKSSLRGGFGVFFDAINANVVSAGQPFYFTYQYATPPGGTSVPLLSFSAIPGDSTAANPVFAGPYSIIYPDQNFRTPYVMASNFGIQQQVGAKGVLEVNYVLRLGRKGTIPVDRNPSIYDCSGAYFQLDPVTYCTGAAATAASYAARARYPGYNASGNSVVDLESVGTSNYNALQAQFREKAGKKLTMLMSYTYARSLDLSSVGTSLSNAVPNPDNVSSQYGPSDNNVTHNFTMGWSYHLPMLTHGFAPVRQVLNNWVYSGIYSVRTGLPFNVVANGDPSLNNEPNQRPSLAPGANPLLPGNRHRADKVKEWYNPTACTSAQLTTVPNCMWLIPDKGVLGTYSRNKMVGPGFTRIDMTLGRIIPLAKIRRGSSLTLRAEAFDVFNTPNLNNPGRVVSATSSAGGGVVTTTYGSNTVAGPVGRRMQLSATYYF